MVSRRKTLLLIIEENKNAKYESSNKNKRSKLAKNNIIIDHQRKEKRKIRFIEQKRNKANICWKCAKDKDWTKNGAQDKHHRAKSQIHYYREIINY